ncbi:C40 family peptidase [Kitasatospora sp. NPDC052896]|uniref:C40 family peptidase n=1 Tax=Kitasatospora sp. NPDC052896 TaxID=3364061 RepID=UPI0037C65E8B
MDTTPHRTVLPGVARLRYGVALATAIVVGTGSNLLGGAGSAYAEPVPGHHQLDGTSAPDTDDTVPGTDGPTPGGADTGQTAPAVDDTTPATADDESTAPATGTSSHRNTEAAVKFALAQVGKPFVMGGNGPNGYDCSGLVQQSYRRAGIRLPRIANDQYEATTRLGPGRLRRGDLLFWSSDGSARGIHHVAVYLGDERYVEAAHQGTRVRISKIVKGYHPTHLGRP